MAPKAGKYSYGDKREIQAVLLFEGSLSKDSLCMMSNNLIVIPPYLTFLPLLSPKYIAVYFLSIADSPTIQLKLQHGTEFRRP
jgi:hypothetical protein